LGALRTDSPTAGSCSPERRSVLNYAHRVVDDTALRSSAGRDPLVQRRRADRPAQSRARTAYIRRDVPGRRYGSRFKHRACSSWRRRRPHRAIFGGTVAAPGVRGIANSTCSTVLCTREPQTLQVSLPAIAWSASARSSARLSHERGSVSVFATWPTTPHGCRGRCSSGPGHTVDGHDLRPMRCSAVRALVGGAAARHPVPQLLVPRGDMPCHRGRRVLRRSLARLVAAVTGTNGKTTVPFLLRSILDVRREGARRADEYRGRVGGGRLPTAEHAGGDRSAAAVPQTEPATSCVSRRPSIRDGPAASRTAVRLLLVSRLDPRTDSTPRDDGGLLRCPSGALLACRAGVRDVEAKWGRPPCDELTRCRDVSHPTTTWREIDLHLRNLLVRLQHGQRRGRIAAARALDSPRPRSVRVSSFLPPVRARTFDRSTRFAVLRSVVDYAHTPDRSRTCFSNRPRLDRGRLIVVFVAGWRPRASEALP